MLNPATDMTVMHASKPRFKINKRMTTITYCGIKLAVELAHQAQFHQLRHQKHHSHHHHHLRYHHRTSQESLESLLALCYWNRRLGIAGIRPFLGEITSTWMELDLDSP
ncbi:unnamed protein product, partial [Allacma fusca]